MFRRLTAHRFAKILCFPHHRGLLNANYATQRVLSLAMLNSNNQLIILLTIVRLELSDEIYSRTVPLIDCVPHH